jgi:hypothetical protein
MNHWTDRLVEMYACPDAVAWCRGYPSLDAAWRACHRGDWMLWLLGRTTTSAPWSAERMPLVRAAVECAALAPECEDPACELAREWCIDAVRRWCDGKADQDEVEAARSASVASAAYAYAADASAYASAAYAYAADAASAAYAYAYASAAYAYAADAANAASAAYASARASADAYDGVLSDCADIVREHFPTPTKQGG